ncbi:L10-interacting MYB domain-containing protein-like [Phalaenopsis equestris]|uniref:L10-interacting MYB domain-containing protein-like n=1 Tax=Phalaenopsis equestris TaxID=78828 RepID=UPI0009E32185|nr:L10-interacting MYB domain-containing protein-like [Phalaenopsis equestris]
MPSTARNTPMLRISVLFRLLIVIVVGCEKIVAALRKRSNENLHVIYCLYDGNRPTTFLNKEGWDNIISKFKKITSREYDRLQLKNKWDQLKKDWKLWNDLKRGSTGLGWDPVNRTIEASEDWWQERLAIVPAAKKFKLARNEPELMSKL